MKARRASFRSGVSFSSSQRVSMRVTRSPPGSLQDGKAAPLPRMRVRAAAKGSFTQESSSVIDAGVLSSLAKSGALAPAGAAFSAADLAARCARQLARGTEHDPVDVAVEPISDGSGCPLGDGRALLLGLAGLEHECDALAAAGGVHLAE